jgi:hypothetical protein
MTDSTATKAKTMGARIKSDATVTEPVKAKKAQVKKVKPTGLEVANPKEFKECTRMNAIYRKGKKDYTCIITGIRNDGAEYEIESPELGVFNIAIEKVMITPPDPEPTEEPAMEILEAIAEVEAIESEAIIITPDGEVAIAAVVEPAVQPKATKKAPLVWRTEMLDVASLPDPYRSPTQIDERMNPMVVADYANMMIADDDGFTVWQWDQEGAQPRLFWDGNIYHYGDAHHRVAGAKLAELATIPCLVTDGTMADAKRYSFKKANRRVGYALTDIQREELIAGVLSDWEMLAEIKAEIYEATGKTEKSADINAMPAARAIAQWLEGLTSYKTVEKVWRMMLTSSSLIQSNPWLMETKRLGIDGKIRKVATENIPSPAPKEKPIPQPAEVAAAFNNYEEPEQRQDDRGPANAPSTTTPAPTNSAPPAPGMQTYTGKAAIQRIAETAEAAAKQLLDRIAKEMQLKVPMQEVYEALEADIRANLEYAIKGE